MAKFRALTLADVATIMALASEREAARDVFSAAEQLAKETCGWRLFTVLRYVEAANAVERVYSSDEKAYPVGGRKPLDKLQQTHTAMQDGSIHLAATRAQVREAYFDHELIFSLGITAILNAPIRHAGQRLGTVNLCGEEGMYDDASANSAKIIAGLLAPVMLRL